MTYRLGVARQPKATSGERPHGRATRGSQVADLGLVAALLVTVATGAVYLAAPNQGVWFALSAVALLALLYARLPGPALLSPVLLVAGVFAAVAVAGALFWDSLAEVRGGTSIQIDLTPDETTAAAVLILTFTAALLAGALPVGWALSHRAPPETAAGRRVQVPVRLLLILSLAPLVFILTRPGFWRRTDYIAEHISSGGLLTTLAATAGLAGLAVAGYAVGRGEHRVLAAIVILGFAVAFLGGGTRRLAIAPVLVAIGYFAARLDRRGKVAIGVALLAAVWLIGLPIELRNLSAHGFFPYASATPGLLVGGQDPLVALRNLVVSFPIIHESAYGVTAFPSSDLWVALTPVGGDAAGWYEIAPQHRLNAYTPYAGIGELGNVGWAAVIGCGAVAGALLAVVGDEVRRSSAAGRQMVALGLVTVSLLFGLLMVQYNLRSAARLLYLAFGLAIVVQVALARRRTVRPAQGRPRPRRLRA